MSSVIYMVPSLLTVAEAQGDDGTLYSVVASSELSPRGELYNQGLEMFKPGCRTAGYAFEPETDQQWHGGRRITRIYKVFDRCPEGIPHTCTVKER